MMRINLRAIREDTKKEKIRQQIIVAVVVLILPFIIIFFWHRSITGQIEAKKKEIQSAKAEIDKIKQVIGEIDKFKEAKTGLEKKLEIIMSLENNRLGPVIMLDELSKLVPERLWLDKLDQKGSKLKVTGSSLDTNNISAFMDRLESSELFSNVVLGKTSAVTKDSYNVYTFDLSFSAAGLVTKSAEPANGKKKKKK